MSRRKVVITDVSIENVDDFPVMFHSLIQGHAPPFDAFPPDAQGHTEYVQGKLYRRSNGDEIVIGLTKNAEGALGFILDEFERLSKQTWHYGEMAEKLSSEIATLQVRLSTLTFWERLFWLVHPTKAMEKYVYNQIK